jgi:hypothetical protein
MHAEAVQLLASSLQGAVVGRERRDLDGRPQPTLGTDSTPRSLRSPVIAGLTEPSGHRRQAQHGSPSRVGPVIQPCPAAMWALLLIRDA